MHYIDIEDFVFEHDALAVVRKAGILPLPSDWRLAVQVAIAHGGRKDLESLFPALLYARWPSVNKK